ncbi:MAG TPA: LamG domain-containing protein [Candidatus Binataceae bacterium]|nr:LamG domain-containing protein [Candidatus Binataceae bacterium]
MVGWWPGDGNANDIVGTNNGTLIGSAGFAPGKVAQAFSLGVGSVPGYVDVPNGSSLHVTGDFTVDAWVYINNNFTDHPCPLCNQTVVDKMNSPAPGGPPNQDGWMIWASGDGGGFAFCLGGGPGVNGCGGIGGSERITPFTWYHLAAVKTVNPDGTANMAFYENGTLRNTASNVTYQDTEQVDIRIGSDQTQGAFLYGFVDEVEVFNRALTAQEIAAIYNAGSAGKCKFLAVNIEIKPPATAPVPINQSSSGVIPVAILSSASFDATQVDPASVSLAGARVKMIGKSDKYSCSIQDVNGDGLNDLLCQVSTAQFMIEPGDSTAELEAQTFGGQPIEGQEAITIVPQ